MPSRHSKPPEAHVLKTSFSNLRFLDVFSKRHRDLKLLINDTFHRTNNCKKIGKWGDRKCSELKKLGDTVLKRSTHLFFQRRFHFQLGKVTLTLIHQVQYYLCLQNVQHTWTHTYNLHVHKNTETKSESIKKHRKKRNFNKNYIRLYYKYRLLRLSF